MSTIYFPRPLAVNAGDIAAAVQRFFPKFEGQVNAPAAGGPKDNLLRVGDTIIAVLNFDVPQPPDTMEVNFKVNFLWQEARQVLSEHKAHTVLAIMKEPKEFAETKSACTALAMAALALASRKETIALQWAPSRALLHGQAIFHEIEDIQAGRLPLDLWLAYSPWAERETGKIGLMTVGLEPFVGREIEMVPRKESLGSSVQRAMAMAEYLLTKGPVVKDGDTVGYSATEHLKVTYFDEGESHFMRVSTEEISR
ncbi:MAG: DUF4261 domain-containing protein [Hyphomicrobiales bacterium]